jgi:hypothetical protein
METINLWRPSFMEEEMNLRTPLLAENGLWLENQKVQLGNLLVFPLKLYRHPIITLVRHPDDSDLENPTPPKSIRLKNTYERYNKDIRNGGLLSSRNDQIVVKLF